MRSKVRFWDFADARFFARNGGKPGRHKEKAFAEKESRRWLDGAERAARLPASGAACITVVADREGDIYEDFASKPEGVEVLICTGQDRVLDPWVASVCARRTFLKLGG
jgi:hypothetical protein